MAHLKLMVATILAATVALSGCSTTQTEFRNKPSSISMAALCRTLLQSHDQNFQREIMAELQRRGIDPYGCYEVVQRQNQAAAALAESRSLARPLQYVQMATAQAAIRNLATAEAASIIGSTTQLGTDVATVARQRVPVVGRRLPRQDVGELG